MGRTPHVLLHPPHAGGGLEVEAAGIEGHPLAHQGHHRGLRVAPLDLDHARGPGGGGSPAHGMDGGIVLAEQVVARDHRQGRAVGLRHGLGSGFQLCGSHVGGGGVDQGPGQRTGHGDAQGLRRGLADDQPRARPGLHLLVAVEAVAAEGEGQGNAVLRPGGLAADAPVPRRQAFGQGPQTHHRSGGTTETEPRLRSVLACPKDQASGLSGKVVQGPEAGQVRVRGQERGALRLRHQPDGSRRRALGNQVGKGMAQDLHSVTTDANVLTQN